MSSSDVMTPRIRSRAKRACKLCNSRRVRCNVTESHPCDNCKSADAVCELVNSRRGKYERRSSRSVARVSSGLSADRTLAPPALSPLYAPVSQARESTYISSSQSPGPRESHSSFMNVNEVLNPSSSTTTFKTSPPTGTTNSNDLDTVGTDSTTVYLGESSSISLVHGPKESSNTENSSTRDRTRLRYPIPDAVSSKASPTASETRRKVARIEYLSQGGVFTVPSHKVCEVLFRAYFAWFHPCFPIIDRFAFGNSYLAKTTSPLLLQSVLFVGASHCNEKTLLSIGLTDRQDARSNFYHRAKDIYDVDHETDKMVVSQAVFLMSFWRTGPLLEKDTRHWLGAAISLAQTKGMHRSSSHVSPRDCKLRKRIWWSLYVRDRQCSAALGLPTRIRDEDCDIEMLEVSDFDEKDDPSQPQYLGRQNSEHILYAIQMAKLARMLGVIVLREFTPRRGSNKDMERSKLHDDLRTWKSDLSPEMSTNATASSFWAGSLHITYNNLEILLYRSAYLSSQEGNDKNNVGHIALNAACRNTRIVEDMLSQNLVQHGNVHLITSLFNSLCIHTINLRRSEKTAKKLAEYRAQLCLLGLRELQSTWDVNNWVLQLFFQFLDQSTARKLQLVEAEEPLLEQSANHNISTSSGAALCEPDALANSESMPTPAYEPLGFLSSRSVNQRHLVDSIDFASHLFGSQEAEDFSMFQLQPELFNGDVFEGGLDQYYSSVIPRGDGTGEYR